MNINPFGRRIYIKPDETSTLIQTPDDRKKLVRGTVISIGEEVEYVEPGDILIFTSWGVDEIEIEGVKHYFLMESDEFILSREPMLSGIPSPLQDFGDLGGGSPGGL
jgi:co-chaperonin GroES (HSP10)